MRWRQLQAFRETMVTGTVSGAAEILGISQPAVSRLIEGLEEALSLSLFDRRSGRLVPTVEARYFYQEVLKAFVSYDQLRIIANDIKLGRRGSLTIACQPAVGLSFLPEAIAVFKQSNPDVTINLDLQASTRVEVLVASQQIDLGFADYPAERYGIERETFLREPYVIALPAGHPLTERATLKPQDLAGVEIVAFTRDVVARRLMETALRKVNVDVKIACETMWAATVMRMVQRGVGIGIIDPFTARDFAEAHVTYRPFIPKLIYHVAVLYPRHVPLSRTASEFLRVARALRKGIGSNSPLTSK